MNTLAGYILALTYLTEPHSGTTDLIRMPDQQSCARALAMVMASRPGVEARCEVNVQPSQDWHKAR